MLAEISRDVAELLLADLCSVTCGNLCELSRLDSSMLQRHSPSWQFTAIFTIVGSVTDFVASYAHLF